MGRSRKRNTPLSLWLSNYEECTTKTKILRCAGIYNIIITLKTVKKKTTVTFSDTNQNFLTRAPRDTKAEREGKLTYKSGKPKLTTFKAAITLEPNKNMTT